MKLIIILFLICFSVLGEDFKERYGVSDALTKIVDNRGNSKIEGLYGTRNMRVVLHNVLYRGGANNMYHKTHPRPNMNPLPEDGLGNLCEQGFSNAIYLYSTNYSTASKIKNCTTNALQYLNIIPNDSRPPLKILKLVHDTILHGGGPIYAHCWNGWHMSGFVAAISLKQFCDLGDEDAVSYWIKGTDGNSVGYESKKKTIKAFKPLKEFEIPKELKDKICPKVL